MVVVIDAEDAGATEGPRDIGERAAAPNPPHEAERITALPRRCGGSEDVWHTGGDPPRERKTARGLRRDGCSPWVPGPDVRRPIGRDARADATREEPG
jgi:hypothetical protein